MKVVPKTHALKKLIYAIYVFALMVFFYPVRIALRLFKVLVYILEKKSMGDKLDKKKKVVVIGGGFAGSTVAKKLQHYLDVTLIDTKNYFEFTPSVLRTLVDVDHLKKIQIIHGDYLPNTSVLQGKAEFVNMDENKVMYSPFVNEAENDVPQLKKKEIDYDYLVLCSGSSYNPPFKNPNLIISTRAVELANCSDRIDKSQKLIMIGGGTVTVELCGEIIDKYPDKEIVIVHSRESLISRAPKKAQDYVTNWLLKYNVTIMYKERVILESVKPVDHEDGTQTMIMETNSGKTIEGDMVFLCTGILSPNSEFLKGDDNDDNDNDNNNNIKKEENKKIENLTQLVYTNDGTEISLKELKNEINKNEEEDIEEVEIEELLEEGEDVEVTKIIEDITNERGFINYNKYLQLNQYDNVFVSGDIMNSNEEKLAQQAQNSSRFVNQNILNLITGDSLKEYKPSNLPIIISLGKYDAVFTFGNYTFSGFLFGLLKEAVEWKVMIDY